MLIRLFYVPITFNLLTVMYLFCLRKNLELRFDFDVNCNQTTNKLTDGGLKYYYQI